MITFHAPQKGPTFLQDEVGGVEIVPPANATNLFVGAGVTLQGYTEPSGLSPRIVVEELRITGTNSLPIPKPGHAGAMMVGQSDGSYIFAEGINRRAKPVGTNMLIRLNRYGPVFPVLLHEGAGLSPADYVDAQVRIEGVSQARFNRQGHVIGSRVLVSSSRQIPLESECARSPT